MKPFYIRKTDLREEAFSKHKIILSLIRSGVDPKEAAAVFNEIKPWLRPNMRTSRIQRLLHNHLQKRSRHYAARYGLKSALQKLGPEGFMFEKLVAEIWKSMGFSAQTNQTLQGRCVSHEIDVLVRSPEGVETGMECKFHNEPAKPCDVKIALYVYARALDLGMVDRFYLVTNTRFTTDALQYARCTKLGIIGWDYPENGGLRELITKHRAYPVSCLTSLSHMTLGRLLRQGILLSKELLEHPEILLRLKLKTHEINAALNEAERLLGAGPS